ncbi:MULTISPECIES: hypothetical protein [Alteromonas]|jgi:hypothetical protein|uniref:STAS/SEC14 domain-containing protein n=2 Tax=Alteromonas stellipolaris TaxID=233316 RepID=A0AAW7Z6X3_9ALTE|nr:MULTISPECIES: hypothetical protein [Alteromonas]ALM89504.1 hypothetical protein AOR13_452 [Alteromonas stellipolaris LMG 21856]MDO6540513.1 hypothetical protein [Alteromonas stellipolaris]MDO6578408.1 hypothetical protein [Alteromonas stellipolaris]MDP2594718.1 hypothetical protein [Alteromonas stellipolaris]
MVPSNIHTIGKHTSHAETKHAEYDIELIGSVLRVDGRGVVNEEILKQYHEDVKDIVISLNGQKWGFLGFVLGTGILTPAAETILIDSIKLRKIYGMSACALVVTNADIPALVQSQFERVYLAADIDYFFCVDEKDGLAWLASKGCKYK